MAHSKARIPALLGALALAAFSSAALAGPIQLVINGNFNSPYVAPDTWEPIANNLVPGWSNNSGYLEIWGVGFNSNEVSPTYNGQPVGQNLEVTTYAVTEYVTSTALVAADGVVDFSFIASPRTATGITYSVTGSSSGVLAGGSVDLSGTAPAWTYISSPEFFVSAGETLTLQFESVGGGGSGAHIDQVSMLYTVPEPATLALLGLGLAGLGFSRRKKA